ncbi:MAG: fibro-slime domain-containing protein [Deltaproteobacteria bacterium]|nr:fibro-slime domain-containing protein [Kofleriaceae bacterium]
MGPQPGSAVAGVALSLVALAAACGPSERPGDGDGDGGDGDGDARAVDAPGGGGDGGEVPIDDCNALRATIRDFQPSTHADFQPPSESDVAYPGLVRPMLGADGKPVYAPAGATPHTAGPAQFAQWYNDTAGVNLPFSMVLALTETSPGRFTYSSSAFFPLDGMGYGNSGIGEDGLSHNFHFTTEIHTTFKYRGGEVFNFNGDDDLWLFINERLAIDLGGLHPSLPGSVNLDQMASALGLETGQTYRMDIFHAERHTDASNFHVETTIDCFIVP